MKTTSLSQSIKDEVLYKKKTKIEIDEYSEGAYYLYNTKKDTSYLVFDGILMDYSEAWITSSNEYVIFTLSSIILLDENRSVIERFDFKETELILGAEFNKEKNLVFFLLKDMKNQIIDLCQFKLENKEIKKVIEDIEITHENIESPFKEMFFMSTNQLLIEDYCYSFMLIDLSDKSISKINIDEGNCFKSCLDRNKNGIIYVKYIDPSKKAYEIKEYNLETNKNNLLLDGRNEYSKAMSLGLFADSDNLAFLLKIDEKIYVYDYRSFYELKIEAKEILLYYNSYLLYLNYNNEVKSLVL